jgi:hypothetical protein
VTLKILDVVIQPERFLQIKSIADGIQALKNLLGPGSFGIVTDYGIFQDTGIFVNGSQHTKHKCTLLYIQTENPVIGPLIIADIIIEERVLACKERKNCANCILFYLKFVKTARK